MASRQETSVQNSTPSRNPVSSPSLLQTLLEHTFLGARPSSPGAAPTGGDIPGADAAPVADPAAGDFESDATDTADADAVGRLELAELLGVLRDPIEWVFTLAERRAQDDPIDIAAIHRVRDAVLHRVNAVIIGAPDTESPRMRTADLWTVAELLIDALDPSLVARVLREVGTSLADALAAGLPFAPSLVANHGRAAAPICGPHVPPPVAPSWYGGIHVSPPIAPSWYGAESPHFRGLCGGACGGLCPGSLAAAHTLRPTVPPWWWSQFPVSF
jgi:hypothetical protein